MKKTVLTFAMALVSLAQINGQNLTADSNSPLIETRQIVSLENEDGVFTLNWTTPEEKNTSYFVIEKSSNGKNFETIGTIKANGYSLTSSDYSYELFDNINSTFNYRVTLVSMNGERLVYQSVNALSNSAGTINQMAAE